MNWKITCKKLTVKSIRQYELIPPVNTSFKSRVTRKCFRSRNNCGKTLYSLRNSCKKKKSIIKTTALGLTFESVKTFITLKEHNVVLDNVKQKQHQEKWKKRLIKYTISGDLIHKSWNCCSTFYASICSVWFVPKHVRAGQKAERCYLT